MPTGYVKKLAKKHHTSVGKSESVWEEAKQQAAKAGKSENFAYITSIYKKMMGEDAKNLSLKGFLAITEMDDVQDMGYSRNKNYDDNFDDEDEFGDESEDEFNDDEFNDDEFGEDEFGEDDLEGHEGHELQGIVGDDELNDEECDPETEECDMDDEFGDDFDEDEFPEEDFPGGDEQPDENGEFPPEDEDEFPPSKHNKFREGYETKGSFLQQLMIITEKAKKKPLKKAAKAVYHRDYVKTKRKTYRKYDPSEHNQER